MSKNVRKNDVKVKSEKMRRRVMSGVLAMTLMMGVQEVSAAPARQTVQSGVGGLLAMTEETVLDVQKEQTKENVSTLRSIVPELQQYAWDSYSSDYYYSRLSSAEQKLYERLDAACGELLSSNTVDAASYEVQSNGAKYTRRGTKMVSTQGLEKDAIKRVQSLFIYSNPQYYFLNTVLLTSADGTCALGIYDSFAEGESRETATAEVTGKLEEIQAQIVDDGVVYETEQKIHDVLCERLSYLSGDVLSDVSDPLYTQTIYGALTSGDTVCAGYTKLYVMLCNYYGIDCVAVTSENHAWNQVRYNDAWYIVDVTWDDTARSDAFFHITQQQMLASDQQASHVALPYYQNLLPVAENRFDESLKNMQGLEQPQVQMEQTTKGVRLTFETDEGEVYYTLDGTVPSEENRYTEPVELKKAGTYVVTAVSAADGSISSAYEIFPVRIAGGKITFSSAKNVSGKKIVVSYKSSKACTGYEFSFASKKDFSDQKTKLVKKKTIQISGLKKGKTYYVRVRGYRIDVYGNHYYTPYSKTKKITVKK